MIILGCDNFGKELAKKMSAKFLLIEKRTFPDSEVCPRILNLRQEADNMKNETVVFANRMTLPLDPNRYLLETFLLIKTINALNPEKIGVVFPYLVYSRQDKVFRDGEPLSIKALFDFLHDVGATDFFTVSSHAERDRKMLTAPMPAYNINGFESIANYFFSKKDKLQNPIVIAPDMKSKTAAKIIADKIGTDFCVMEKHRDLDTGDVDTADISVDIRNRDVIIIDDIISSGGTMLNTINIIHSKEPKNVYCAVVHLVLQQGLEKIQPYVTKLISSDTIQTPVSKITVIPQLVEKLKEVYS